MAMRLASGSAVEAVVTLAAAAMMTLAGFEMLTGIGAPADAATRAAAVQGCVVPAPRLDEARG